jgi:hypothetical protein
MDINLDHRGGTKGFDEIRVHDVWCIIVTSGVIHLLGFLLDQNHEAFRDGELCNILSLLGKRN